LDFRIPGDGPQRMTRALRAFAVGLQTTLMAPLLVAGITLATVASVVPFGVVLGSRLQTSLSQQQPVSAVSTDIDPEWWMEYRAHATGLEATFTPAIIGFAAPLDNLSALLDASSRPWALAIPIGFSVLVWAWLWGGVLHRFAQGGRLRPGQFFKAGTIYLPRLVLISVAVVPVYAVLYMAVHPVLFGPIYDWLAGLVSSERDAFFMRVALYTVFGALLMTVALVVDYARIGVVTSGLASPLRALGTSLEFVRGNKASVVTLYLCTGVLLAVMLTAYGTGEVYGGTLLGGWRAVAIGQTYIVGRLALRLALAAAEVQLWARGQSRLTGDLRD
jgi:hypothetical protein